MLLAIALLGIGLAAASELWAATARQQNREQLDWVGAQFVQATGSYYNASSGTAKVYPAGFADLLEDRRVGAPRRHLRRLYIDPFSGKADWELVMGSDGRLHGVKTTVPTAQGDRRVVEFVYMPGVP